MRSLLPVLAALVALPLGWVVTHYVVRAFGYTTDPARGPAITGSLALAAAAGALAWELDARRN